MTKQCVLAGCLLLVSGRSAAALTMRFETYLDVPIAFERSADFTLRGFDPAWGTLNLVWFDVDVTYFGDVLFTNEGDHDLLPETRLQLAWRIVGRDWEWHVGEASFSVGANWLIPPGGSEVVHFGGFSIGYGFWATPAPFVTSGPVPATLFTDLCCSTPQEQVSGRLTRVWVQHFYDYTPAAYSTPEPTTMMSLGLGAAALLASRRRARR
jgi:hypothetical protein